MPGNTILLSSPVYAISPTAYLKGKFGNVFRIRRSPGFYGAREPCGQSSHYAVSITSAIQTPDFTPRYNAAILQPRSNALNSSSSLFTVFYPSFVCRLRGRYRS